MTTTQVLQVFDILQDKYGAPFFPPAWKIDMFNMCQYEFLHDLLPEEGGESLNFDFSSNITKNIQPLIYSVSVNMDSTGLVTTTALDAAIQAASADATAKLFRIMSIGILSGIYTYEVKYLKQNNKWAFENNYFKKPSSPKKVKYEITAPGLKFSPVSTTTALKITVIKTPRAIDDSPVVNPEWDDYVCYNLIAKMLKLAGIATGSDELINEVRMTSIAQ